MCLSTLRWAGAAANENSLADPNATFDPTLPCASGEDAARDAIVYADAPKSLIERLENIVWFQISYDAEISNNDFIHS